MNNKVEKRERTFRERVNRDQRKLFPEEGFKRHSKHMFKHVKMIFYKICELSLLLLLKPFRSVFQLFQRKEKGINSRQMVIASNSSTSRTG